MFVCVYRRCGGCVCVCIGGGVVDVFVCVYRRIVWLMYLCVCVCIGGGGGGTDVCYNSLL